MGTTKNTNKKRVLIVDDHPIMRRGVAQLVEQEPDLTVCGEADDVYDALEKIEKLNPDVAIVDIKLKDSGGVELIKDMGTRWPELAILVLSMHDESLYAERVLRAGARGYVTNREPPERIVEGIRRILEGSIYVSENLARKMLRAFVTGKPGSDGSLVERLSDRQFQVFELIGQGLKTREIAARLHLSVKTVDTHREHIKKRLTLESGTDLLRYAIQWVHFENGT